MKRTVSLLMTIFPIFLGMPCLAKKVHSPLNPKIVAAKSAFIESHGNKKLADETYRELKKWKGWEIVADQTKADLVVEISLEKAPSSANKTPSADPNAKMESSAKGGLVRLELLDAKWGVPLYSDTGKTAQKVIRKLIEKIEKENE